MTCTKCDAEWGPEPAYCGLCGTSLGSLPLPGYAAVWRRGVALVLDIALTDLIGGVIALALGLNRKDDVFADAMSGLITNLVWAVYFISLESSTYQATVGKLAMGIRVGDLNGRRIGFWNSVGRNFGKLLSLLTLVGFPMATWTAKRQALHDRMARTVVLCKGGQMPLDYPALRNTLSYPVARRPTSAAEDSPSVDATAEEAEPARHWECPHCDCLLAPGATTCSSCWKSVAAPILKHRYSGFWRRAGAVCVDLVLFYPAISILGHLLGVAPSPANRVDWGRGPFRGEINTEQMRLALDMAWHISQFIGFVYFLLAPYYVLMESSPMQGTIGKRLFGLRVTDLKGARISLRRAMGRYSARMLSATIWQMGFVMTAFTPKKQGLHDMVAGTLVVRPRM